MSYLLKTIASNTLAQLVAKFFGAGLTLLTTYYIIAQAGIDLYGDLTKILVLVAVGFTAIDFGLNAEGIRASHTKTQMQNTLSAIILARLFLSCLIIAILNLVILLLPGGYSPEIKAIFWLGSLAIIFQGIYTSGNAWFQYRLLYWRSTISVIVGSLIGASLTIYFLYFHPTLPYLVLATTLGYLAMALITLLLLPNLRPTLHDLRSIFPLLRRSLTLGLILVASVVASKLDSILLGILRPSSEVGQYGFAYRIFDVSLVLPVFIMNSIYPLSLKLSHASQKSLLTSSTRIMALFGGAVALCLYYLAPAITLPKPGLDISITSLRFLALSLPLFYLTAPLMWALIARHKDRIVLTIYVGATLLNLVLNLWFIPGFGATAAAINTGITELFIFLSLLYFFNTSKPLQNL